MIDASVSKKLDRFQLSAEVHDGGFICLSGRNGSGKSCFLRSVAGLLKPDDGRIVIGGVDVTNVPVERRGVVMVTPASFLPHLRVDAHLVWGARLRGVQVSREKVNAVRSALGIEGAGRVGILSLGNRERVALASALLSSPRAILVDEAFSNLHERREFITGYRKLTQEAGVDVVFSTQDESDFTMSDHAYTISDGKTQKRSWNH